MSRRKLVKENNRADKSSGILQVENVVRDILHAVITIYMLLVIAVMPFYNQAGYSHIGTDKYTFLKTTGICGAWIVLPLVVLMLGLHLAWMLKEDKRSWKQRFQELANSLSVTDKAAIAYAMAVILSYLCTDYPEEALWGTRGWYMGMATQLLFVSVYFLISRCWKKTWWVPFFFLPVSAVVFLLGYLNRFGVYPVAMQSAQPSFISTIGNINWYCGYLVTVFFSGVYLLWRGALFKSWIRALLFVYTGIGFASLVTQGSSSGIFALAGILLTLFLMSAFQADGEKAGWRMKAFWEIVLTLAAACVVTWGVRMLFPQAITYEEGTTNLLTLGALPFVMLAVAAGFWLWVRSAIQKENYPVRIFCGLAWAAAGAVAGGILLFVLLIIINTLRPGSLGSLSELPVFTFTPGWGSNRGATWKAGIMCFMEQGIWKKLVGVGPDCMSSFIYGEGSQELCSMVQGCFGGNRLTNAHNEWLTILVNCGLLGMGGYAVMIVSAIRRFLKIGSSRYIAGAAGLCILAYSINNIFSFQQSMNAITMFVIMGVGEAYARKGCVLES